MEAATIKDIARQAGLSVATVSRVMNGNYPVSESARSRVREAMAALNYRPNGVARSLRSNRTNLIALVAADMTNPFFMEAAKGLEEVLSRSGYSLVVASSGGSAEKERQLLETLAQRRVDGLCIASAAEDAAAVGEVIDGGIPTVLIDRGLDLPGASQVLWDDKEMTRRAAGALLDSGHRRVAMLNVMLAHMTGRSRLEGYVAAHEERGLPIDQALISGSGFLKEDATEFVKTVMTRSDPPTAFLCGNNVMAGGALAAFKELSLAVGEDVALVSVGQLSFDSYLPVPISAMRLDSVAMGRAAGEIMLSQIEGRGETRRVVLPAEFIPTDSLYTNNIKPAG